MSSFEQQVKKKQEFDYKAYKHQKRLFNCGIRYWNCMHARLRMGCSKLNEHLYYNLHVIDSPSCTCGSPSESVQHYFFECDIYCNQRVLLFNNIKEIAPVKIILNT